MKKYFFEKWIDDLSSEVMGIQNLVFNLTLHTSIWHIQAAISQITFSNAFSWMKIIVFYLKFYWNMFPCVQLTIWQHRFRWWLGTKQALSHHLIQSWPRSLMHICPTKPQWVNTLSPRQNGRLFPDDIYICIFLNENISFFKISLKFVPKGLINNIPALVQIMAWRCPGDEPLSEPMSVSLPTHVCVTWPQWVNPSRIKQFLHSALFNTLRQKQNGGHFTEDISNALYEMKFIVFVSKFPSSLLPRVQLTIQ